LGNKQKETKIKPKGYIINPKMKKQRIDNTFAMASKVLKNVLVSKWQKLNDYLASSKYMEVAGLLKDCNIGVVSNTNIILTCKYESIIDSIYDKFDLVLELLNEITEDNYALVLLTEEEFKNEVQVFKEHMNDKNYYTYKEEDEPFIKIQNIEIENNDNLCYGSLVQKAIDVFGSEYVEIE